MYLFNNDKPFCQTNGSVRRYSSARFHGALSTAAAAGTAALATGAAGAGLLGAAAIKDAVDHHHSGSSGSSGGSSGGSQTTSVADQTISRVQTMSKAQVETEIRTLVTTAGAPRPSSKYSCKDNVVIFLFLISILAKLILSKTEVVFNHLIKCLLTFCSCYITTQDVQMVMFVIIVEKKRKLKMYIIVCYLQQCLANV